MSLKKYFFIALIAIVTRSALSFKNQRKSFLIMLNPAGDANYAGRTIDDCFERGLTFQYVEYLKKALETQYPEIRVIITRFPGEAVDPLQNAHFANRLSVDLYISIHFYAEQHQKNKVFLYHFITTPTDYWSMPTNQLFIPYDQAHRAHSIKTQEWATTITKELKKEPYNKEFETYGPFGIPFKPLMGIHAPAIAIEASLKNRNDWKQYINPIIKSLEPLIKGISLP